MKWIAIKDQLPPIEGKYVLLWKKDWFFIGFREVDRFYDEFDNELIATHWAEITPPEIGETRSHGHPPGARSRATTSKMAAIPSEKGRSAGSAIDPDSGTTVQLDGMAATPRPAS